jgi:hypothetical protein
MQKNRTSLLLWIFWGFMLILSFVMIRWIVPNASSKVTKHANDPENAEILDVKPFGFTKAEAFQALDAMGEEGRRQYIGFHRREDMAFPLVYGLFFTLTIYLLLRNRIKKNNIKYLILVVPILAMMGDLTENHHVMMLINEFPGLSSRTVTIASIANSVKWGALIVSLGAIIILVILNIAIGVLKSGLRKTE